MNRGQIMTENYETDSQGRINHVANVSIETGLPSKYEF